MLSGNVFEPVNPVSFGDTLNGLGILLVDLFVFLFGRVVSNVAVFVSFIAEATLLFLEFTKFSIPPSFGKGRWFSWGGI